MWEPSEKSADATWRRVRSRVTSKPIPNVNLTGQAEGFFDQLAEHKVGERTSMCTRK
jgi:hypothetical protein